MKFLKQCREKSMAMHNTRLQSNCLTIGFQPFGVVVFNRTSQENVSGSFDYIIDNLKEYKQMHCHNSLLHSVQMSTLKRLLRWLNEADLGPHR
jgi:hypothetical protein